MDLLLCTTLSDTDDTISLISLCRFVMEKQLLYKEWLFQRNHLPEFGFKSFFHQYRAVVCGPDPLSDQKVQSPENWLRLITTYYD